jgi:hypothetical protein
MPGSLPLTSSNFLYAAFACFIWLFELPIRPTVCTLRSGTVMARGAATYTELFSAGSGNRYLTGFQGQINIKHDGSGSVGVSPASGAAMPFNLVLFESHAI